MGILCRWFPQEELIVHISGPSTYDANPNAAATHFGSFNNDSPCLQYYGLLWFTYEKAHQTLQHPDFRELGNRRLAAKAAFQGRKHRLESGGIKRNLDSIYMQYFHSFILLLLAVKLPEI